jgi:hypothetical protein
VREKLIPSKMSRSPKLFVRFSTLIMKSSAFHSPYSLAQAVYGVFVLPIEVKYYTRIRKLCVGRTRPGHFPIIPPVLIFCAQDTTNGTSCHLEKADLWIRFS